VLCFGLFRPNRPLRRAVATDSVAAWASSKADAMALPLFPY
jgi:hypothetical protein